MKIEVSVCCVVVALACAVAPAVGQIVINEIHYHPANFAVGGGEDPEDLQFIELHNAGPDTVDLTGWSWTEGVVHTFGADTTLAAGEFLVLAKNAAFLQSHVVPPIPGGVAVVQWTSGDLANSGEALTLVDDLSATVDTTLYDDIAPWPAGPDGNGPSLELVHPTLDNAEPAVWREAAATNGTPGTQNSAYSDNPILIGETPPRSSTITALPDVSVTFAEPVQGVVASNLTVNSSLATTVTCDSCSGGVGAGPYVFAGFAAPVTSPISVSLAPASIQDESGNPFDGDSWIYSFDTPDVVINELHYHPADPNGDAEFIELYNAELDAVDISGWSLTEFASPGYTFPASTVLAAGDYVVVAKDTALLFTLTGFSTPHSWGLGDSLSNAGEAVRLTDHLGIVVDRVVYSDDPPWPVEPDGSGPSLELIDPLSDNSLAGAWYPSFADNGTPGAENSVSSDAPNVVSEIPVRRTAVDALTEVTVVFSTEVTGVTAGDLGVAGSPATAVVPATGPADTYTFSGYAPPATGSVTISLAPGSIMGGGLPFLGDSWTVSVGRTIVINEIHYHPADPDADAEFIEFYNAGASEVDLDGWFVSDGVDLAFAPGTMLGAGEYLVIAFDAALLHTLTGYAGALEWSAGRLSNSGERIALSDADGNMLDVVEYSDGGSWPGESDGDGPSSELLSPTLPNEYGPTWSASGADHGTPGAQNSGYQAAPAPIIFGTLHDPPIPASFQDLRVTATVIDDSASPTVTLYYRQDENPTLAYNSVLMLDDGFSGDGAAGDNVYGAIVPGLDDGQRLDFTIRADDGVSVSAAPAGHDTLFESQHPSQTYLCKFSDDAPYTDLPHYHLITTARTRYLQGVRTKTEYDATFLQCDAAGDCEIFYNVLERYRGQSSLTQDPPSFHISFPAEQPLQSEMGFEVRRLLLMGQQPARQMLGFDMFDELGDPASRMQLVRLNTNPLSHTTGGATTHQDYSYANIERVDDDFVDSQGGDVVPTRYPDICDGSRSPCTFDTDCSGGESCVPTSGGNMYRGRNDATLRWEGSDPAAYEVDVTGRNGYQRITNQDAPDAPIGTDLINLCDALNCSSSDGGVLCTEDNYDGWYADNIEDYVDAAQWGRWFGLHRLIWNTEGGIYFNSGDDYFLYFEPGTDLATFTTWDMDAFFANQWQGPNQSIWSNHWQPAVDNFLKHNAFAGRFVGSLCEALDTFFTQEEMDARIDAVPDVAFQTLQGPQGGGPTNKQGMKDWVASRRDYLLNGGGIVWQTTVDDLPASPYTDPNPVVSLSGQLSQCWTHDVLINGQPVDNFSVFGATWSGQVTLEPGVNNIVVQCLDHEGFEVDRVEEALTYDPPGGELRLTMPTRMVNDRTLTLKAEVLDSFGRIDWRTFAALGTVSAVRVSDQSSVPIQVTVFETLGAGAGAGGPATDDEIRFYNGVGSVSFTLVNGAAEPPGDIEVTVTVGGLSASRVATILDVNAPGLFKELSGVLSGGDLTWGPSDGVIHLSSDVIVDGGNTLTILPGTLVMVDKGLPQDGVAVEAQDGGTVDAQGTPDEPIFFFATEGLSAMALPQASENNPNSWRGFYHEDTGSSTYRHVFVTGAGNATVTAHPRPPIFRNSNAHALVMEDCVLADCPGMGHSAYFGANGTYEIRRCLFSRLGIGGEWLGTGYTLTVEDSWFTRIGRAPEAAGVDGDILHIDRSGNTVLVRGCVLTDCGDDMIDHSTGATPVIEDCIIYDARDKTVSLDGSAGATITMTNCLVYTNPGGVRCAGGDAFLTHCTFGVNGHVDGRGAGSDIDKCIFYNGGSMGADTCTGAVNYTLVNDPVLLGCGTGNFHDDPLFVDPASGDYSLQAGSPAMDAGPVGERIGWLGFPDATACLADGDCDDSDPCSVGTCVLGACTYTPVVGCCNGDADCDDGLPCTGQETCDLDYTCLPGIPVDCGSQYCDPADGSCVDCLMDEHCDDGVGCTDDSCEPDGSCLATANDANCPDDGLFCNGPGVCDPLLDCDQAGNPCPPGEVCDEFNDQCGPFMPDPPAVAAVGSRYLEITPPAGLSSVALQVSSASVPCLPRYVDAAGRLVDAPVFMASEDWGTVYAGDEEVVPSTLYEVRADARIDAGEPENLSDPASDTTWLWGDADFDDSVTVLDIMCVLNGFQDVYVPCSLYADDLRGDVPDAEIDVADILAVLDGFQSLPYPDADPCAARGSLPPREEPAHISLVPASSVVWPGETFLVDALVGDVVDLRGYQVSIDIVPLSGTGTLSVLCPEGALVDEIRGDYVFAGLPDTYPVTNCDTLTGASALLSGGVDVSETPEYLLSYLLSVSEDAVAGTTFEVSLRDAPGSLLKDSLNEDLSFTLGEPHLLTVGECSAEWFGDADFDGDVDIGDFAGFGACMLGDDPEGHCCVFDADSDGDVDLEDYAAFQRVFGSG